MNKQSILFFIFFIVLSSNLLGQTCCDNESKMTLCYFPTDEFCSGANCEYNFDSEYMEGIWKKVNNTANFGPNGTIDCEIETRRLGNIMSAADIESQECDIVFIGTFYINSNITSTYLPIWITDAVLEWTVKCTQNLTILFQGESRRWGYIITDENINPNSPNAGVTTPNIFNGPFGSLNNFNQGGTYQANFQSIPTTGATILAQDLAGRPTIVLDQATNDIILADVGIMCNLAGDVTNSEFVSNNNDILACNLFALGCAIVTEEIYTNENALLCEDSDYTLPDGIIVDQPGEYISTLLSVGGCDSIITTSLEFYVPEPFDFNYIGCDQDGFSIDVGGTTYDQSNPIGAEIVTTSFGCDSLVNISLVFNANSEHQIDTTICPQESFEYLGFSFSEPTDTIIIIPNAINCDSVISVSVGNFLFDNIEIGETEIEIINNQSYYFQNNISSNYQFLWTPSQGLSCDNCPNPILNNMDNITQYALQIISDDGCEMSYTFNVEYICTPYIPNVFNPDSFTGNDTFGPLTSCDLTQYNMRIYDRWGTLVFQTNDQNEGWNGLLKNKEVVPGVYVYQCVFTNRNVAENRSGQLTLVR